MDAQVTPASNEPIDVNLRIAQFVKLRDKIKELDDAHKEKMAPYRETLTQLESVLLGHLNTIGADSASTEAGTVYKRSKDSASVADMSAFWTHVVTQGDWDLVDKKANVSAVREFIEKNGTVVPGVNFTSHTTVGVRRK